MYERFGLYSDGKAPHALFPLGQQNLAGAYRRHLKRAFDIALVCIAAVPAGLLIGIFAVLVMVRERAAPFYRQDRVGLNGQVFGMWKLRTMVPGAEAVLDSYLAANPAARAEWNKHQKLKDDPRVTGLGRILRRTSLDELPQLWNVLMGDMSLVGPRPMMCNQRALYPGAEYYVMRPGITGFWQTSLRNESSFHERAGFDQAYFRELSFGTDIRVLWRTVSVVLRGTGH